MNKKNLDTEEILGAIKNMMSDNRSAKDQPLPQDIMDLTDSIDEKNNEVLELTELVVENSNLSSKDEIKIEDNNNNIITEEKLRKIVKDEIQSIPQSKIDEIINEELSILIKNKLISSKIIIRSEDE